MKIKRVKDQILANNQKHLMLSGEEGKTIVITGVEFYNIVEAFDIKGNKYLYDDVGIAVFKKSPQSVVLALGEHAIGGFSCPLYLDSEEELIIFHTGPNYNQTNKKLNYIITYEELENA